MSGAVDVTAASEVIEITVNQNLSLSAVRCANLELDQVVIVRNYLLVIQA